MIWLTQGGRITFEAYTKKYPELLDKHKEFFKNQVNYFVKNKYAYVHGGYTSLKGLGHEQYIANYYWDRNLWQTARSGNNSQELPNLVRMYDKIFIGHTSIGHRNPQKASNVWNLDTGGGHEGVITIMNVDTEEFWQSDPLKDLYFNEKGRR